MWAFTWQFVMCQKSHAWPAAASKKKKKKPAPKKKKKKNQSFIPWLYSHMIVMCCMPDYADPWVRLCLDLFGMQPLLQ